VNTARLLTPPAAGAVAVIEVRGTCQDACVALSARLPAVGGIHLAHCAGIDDMLLARPLEDRLLIMPHGGRQVVDATLSRLAAGGFDHSDTAAADTSDIERLVMMDLHRAQTPLALELLLTQPARWSTFSGPWTDEDEARSSRLRRLLEPPRVALAGPPNIGKSTLLNALAGRDRAVVSNAEGTTRDWIGVRIDLGGLAVDWADTPGIRLAEDPVEAASIRAAQTTIDAADLLVAAADPTSGWPQLPRPADLRLGLRADLGPIEGADLACAALRGDGLEGVVQAVRSRLVPDADLTSERPWRWRGDGPVPGPRN
jgi:tRNA modification GTPase